MTKPADLKPSDRINADQYRALMALVLEYGDARANLRAGWSTSERADVLLKRIRDTLTDALAAHEYEHRGCVPRTEATR